MTKKRTRKRAPLGNFRVEELGIDVQHVPSDNDTQVDAEVLAEIGYHEFDRCPICLGSGPMTNEDVPPKSMGGRVLTRTCGRCNNRLGTRVEAELFAWYVGALRQIRVSSPGSDIPGSRKSPDMLHRTTSAGEFWIQPLYPNKTDPVIPEMLGDTNFELGFTLPEPRLYQIAALKHAYLGACLQVEDIPQSESAKAIRRDLVAAREAPDNRSVPASSIADALTLGRAFERQQAPPLALCKFQSSLAASELGIVLAGALLVSWPFPDVSPAALVN